MQRGEWVFGHSSARVRIVTTSLDARVRVYVWCWLAGLKSNETCGNARPIVVRGFRYLYGLSIPQTR